MSGVLNLGGEFHSDASRHSGNLIAPAGGSFACTVVNVLNSSILTRSGSCKGNEHCAGSVRASPRWECQSALDQVRKRDRKDAVSCKIADAIAFAKGYFWITSAPQQ